MPTSKFPSCFDKCDHSMRWPLCDVTTKLIAHFGGEQFETFVTNHTENSPANSSA